MPPPPEITLPDEFASTMQQLVAEAAKTVGPRTLEATTPGGTGEENFASLSERLTNLEHTFTQTLARSAVSTGEPPDFAAQLERMEQQLAALCQTESVNHRLFNSLHQELKSYRDNFLRESLQKPFIRDLVMLFDDLNSLAEQMESAASQTAKKTAVIHQWSTNLQNAVEALLEVLHRMDVNPIEGKEFVDRAVHRVVSFEPAEFVEDDGRIVLRVKRGFIWRDQVLRPEEVVAKRFG